MSRKQQYLITFMQNVNVLHAVFAFDISVISFCVLPVCLVFHLATPVGYPNLNLSPLHV